MLTGIAPTTACEIMNSPSAAPKVSVLMSVYNGSQYLREAVDSILNQTFTNFEFIIIDDCSTDNSWEILTNFADRDARIVLIKNQENCGLTKSLNKGLDIARGEYIARQDDDDVSYLDRLHKQVAYLDSHPSIAFVSTGVDYINENGNFLWNYIPEVDPVALRWNLFFKNTIRHSTAFWRRELINQEVGDYDSSFTYSQDYDLWIRIAEKFLIATLPEALVKLRWHEKSITLTKIEKQDALATQVTHRQVNRYLTNTKVSIEEAANLRAMPQVKYQLQQQRFSTLKAPEFEKSANLYLQLWGQFFAKNLSANNAISLRVVQAEIESSLLSWLKHCQQQQWLLMGNKIAGIYLINFPGRTLPIALAILQKLGLSVVAVVRHSRKKLSHGES